MKAETRLVKRIRLALSGLRNVKLFRNNCGVLQDKFSNYVRYGLFVGSGDLIGWTTRTITQEMVGSTVAIFTSVEVKTGTGVASLEQKNWKDAVESAGGIALIVCDEQQAIEALKK